MDKASKKSFRALIVTQFFGAFNDNVYKILVSLLVVAWVSDPRQSNQLVALGTGVFAAPFLIFSMAAGRFADKLSKSRIIVATKFWEVAVVLAGIASLWLQSIPLMMVSLFMLSLQATFFSPAKYGILPEIVPSSSLSNANAWLNIATFSAILVGTLTAGYVVKDWRLAASVLFAATTLGLLSSFFIQKLPAVQPETPLKWNPFTDLLANWQVIAGDRSLKLSIIAVNFFWFMGAALQINIFLYAKQMMGASESVSTLLIVAIGVGIGLGSYLAGRLSGGKVEMGFVPIGALVMTVFTCDLLWAHTSRARVFFDFFMVGAGAGLYDIPLVTFIQWRSPAAERGKILATSNFLSFVAIAIAGIVLWLLGTVFSLNPAQVFFALGLISLVGTFTICAFIPDTLLRLILYTITNTIYRIHVFGREHVPKKGPALLVVNHLSLADGFLVAGAIPRLIRFLMWRPYFEDRRAGWFFRTMKAIPISENDPPREILRSLMTARKALEEGHLVCIFAEGQVSRTGNLLEFKRGFEVIVKGLDVPVIPVLLDRVWGSIFSFEGGKSIWKWPRQIPYPVTITFGEPLRPPVTPEGVRQKVQDLSADAFIHRMEKRHPLPLEFLKQAKRHPSLTAIIDSTGKSLSFGDTAAASRALALRLAKLFPPARDGAARVGIMLPPSVGGALANIAVGLTGAIPVNLNYTSGADILRQCVEKAGIERILTSRKLLEKTALPATPAMIYLEDVFATLSKTAIIKERILFWLLPIKTILSSWGAAVRGDLHETAGILFSSGSTGVPKGVTLSHANILSNILGLAQVFDIGKKDRILGVLPFFHSFGFTATIWFPLIHGFTAVYHTNPLDSKTIGELCKRHHVSVLIATPTFLSAYTRKCSTDQFQYLRLVITGAERLRESIAKAFQEKFGKLPLEGYGCTELSPVACANVPDVSMGEIHQVGHKPGKIGHPLPGVAVKIVDPDTFAPIPQGKAGLLLVKGPNVMKGYWKDPQKTQEVIRDGWYVTGDIASIDNDGFVQLTDRLSRFSKIGGEMVPHVMVEEKLHQIAARSELTFVVTGVPDEKKGEQLVVLYTEFEGTIDVLWDALNQSGLSRLWIPAKDRFLIIETIPLLGTGKLDLVKLRQLALQKTNTPAG